MQIIFSLNFVYGYGMICVHSTAILQNINLKDRPKTLSVWPDRFPLEGLHRGSNFHHCGFHCVVALRMGQRQRFWVAASMQSPRQICSVIYWYQGDCGLVTSFVHHVPRRNGLCAAVQFWRHCLHPYEAATREYLPEITERHSFHRISFFHAAIYPAITRADRKRNRFGENGTVVCEPFRDVSSLNQVNFVKFLIIIFSPDLLCMVLRPSSWWCVVCLLPKAQNCGMFTYNYSGPFQSLNHPVWRKYMGLWSNHRSNLDAGNFHWRSHSYSWLARREETNLQRSSYSRGITP